MNNHYVCVVGFETDKLDKETGNPKIKKYKFIIEGVTLYDALNTMIEYLKTDSRGYDIKSITECLFEDILGQKTKSAVVQIS